MVTKKHASTVSAHKEVKLKAHHAKAYRKRHVGLLFVSLAALLLLGVLLVQYRDQIVGGFSSNKSFVSNLFPQDKNYTVNIASSYGFNVSYDQKTFYASAISADTGDLHMGTELGQRRAYNVVRIAPNMSSGANSSMSTSTMTMTLHQGGDKAKEALDMVALQDGDIDATKVTRGETTDVTLGGQSFKKNTWQSKASSDLSPALTARFVTYSGLIRGDVFTVAISLGVTSTDDSLYGPVLNTLGFDNKVSAAPQADAAVVAKTQSSRSLLDILTNTQMASAASKGVDLTGSEKVAALYSPAVVKIYNAYCMDVSVDGKPYGKNFCKAASGSGFFVSQDGYIATNGHVAATTPQDLAIADALGEYVKKGEPKYLNYLMNLTSLKSSDLPKGASATEIVAKMVDALYKLDADRFTATNDVENLLVQVTPKNPDIKELLQDTKDRKEYSSSDKNVLKAKLVASDYRANDGYDGFRASDVAIIKVKGENYPIVKLGSITTASQGSGLSILGYPGNASNNGIVDATSSSATLTTGKVSSVKNASGSDKKLIETDTTIGHGNSGGPALADNGEVVGIATYTADGSGEGNGVFNYIRDIKDLTDLARDENIAFDTNSKTQAAWQEGIANYYSSHYSKALKYFAEVEELYPNDSKVADFTANAQKKIDAGEDVVDFPLIPVLIAAGVILLGIGLGLFFIIRHHKKHILYNKGVAQGTNPGVAPLGNPAAPSPGAQYAPVAPHPSEMVQSVPVPPPVAQPAQVPVPAPEPIATPVEPQVPKPLDVPAETPKKEDSDTPWPTQDSLPKDPPKQ